MTDNPRTLSQARDVAVAAARRAARVVRFHAGRLADHAVRSKAYNELVTEADVEAQRLVIETLHEAFPGDAVLAEEGADDPFAQPEADGYRWIIDPIDGTTNFTHGLPPYGISIALQHRAEVVVGVVLEVARDELFTAIRGEGLYRNGTRVRTSGTRSLADSLVTTGFPYRSFAHADAYFAVLKDVMARTRGVRRPGAASVDLAYVACGRFDAFFESGLAPWDVAAGLLLVEEGGGRVTDFADGANPAFSRQILATNGAVHAAMLDVVAPMRDTYA